MILSRKTTFVHPSLAVGLVVGTFLMGSIIMMISNIPTTSAVLYGDEQFGDVTGGKFWAFYNGGIAVIDPATCAIEKTITTDHDGEPLPTSWNDGVYMQTQDATEGYVMIGSRVDETNDLGDVVSHAYAVSTTARRVVSKVEVG
jgi:hypothetical protein